MGPGGSARRYVWHPAADDRRLAQACTEVRAGRSGLVGAVLAEARDDFGVRAHRSLVLAATAADSDLAERWLAEQPGPDAALLWARVAVLRALRASDGGDGRSSALVRIAHQACVRAGEFAPKDPTPWVSLLNLARVIRPREPAPPELLTRPQGPWPLFAHITALDPENREAHHRMLAHWFSRHGGSASERWDVAEHLGGQAPADSPLRLLPLVALLDDYRSKPELLADRIWQQDRWRALALDVYEQWLPAARAARFRPVVDLSYLAHALVTARCLPEARAVLEALEPYASGMPWGALGEAEAELGKARRRCGLPVPAPP